MTGLLADRTIVVVGAGTQPSDDEDAPAATAAIAVAAARAGARVVCVDRDAASAETTAARARAEGGRADVVVADVREAAASSLVAEAVAVAGPELHGVVLNVGIGRGRGLEGTSVDDWDTVFAVNLRGHFLVAQAAAPHVPRAARSCSSARWPACGPAAGHPPTTRRRRASSASTGTWRSSTPGAACGRTSWRRA